MLLFTIIFPVILASGSFFARKSSLWLERFTVASMGIELASVILVASSVARGGAYTVNQYFSVDALGALVLLVIATVGFLVATYSVYYLREEVKKKIIGFHRVRQYFALFNLFIAVMYLAVISTSPIIMWIAIEATTLATAFLISFYNKPSAMEAAWKYLIINSVGLMLGFFGTLLFLLTMLGATGDSTLASWDAIAENVSRVNPFLIKVAFIFVLIGYGTKMGLAPMHTWLPDAHSKAPVPISGLLSGVLLNVAFLAILRYKFIVDKATGAEFSASLLIFFGIISIMISAFIIFIQKNYKRLLAYSSIEHMGIAALGFGFGGLGIFAALLHMVYHSLAKSLLFLASGNIFLKYSSTKIAKVKGVMNVLPVTGGIFMMGFLAITGVPPFGIFLTETYILSAGIARHPIVTVLALLSFILVFAGFLKHITAMMFGKTPEGISRGEAGKGTLVPLIILMTILIILSFALPDSIQKLITSAASRY